MARRKRARTVEEVRHELQRAEAAVDRALKDTEMAILRLRRNRKRMAYYSQRLQVLLDAAAQQTGDPDREHRNLNL